MSSPFWFSTQLDKNSCAIFFGLLTLIILLTGNSNLFILTKKGDFDTFAYFFLGIVFLGGFFTFNEEGRRGNYI